MKYYKQTARYVSKNILYIFPLSIVPALFFAFSVNQESVLAIWNAIKTASFIDVSFTHVFRTVSLLNFASWETTLLGIVGAILFVLFASMLMAFLDKHMRIGKRTLNGIFAKVNDNFLSTFFVVSVLAILYEAWALITSAVLYLLMQIGSVIAVYILCAIAFVGAIFLFAYFISYFYLWLPCLQLTGFRSLEALRSSFVLLSPVRFRVVMDLFVSLLFMNLIIGATVVLVPGELATFIVATLVYSVAMLFFFTRMQIVYFERSAIDREDLKIRFRY